MLTERQQIVLDEMTPGFKATMERLPPQERKVFATLAEMDRIATSREGAEQARLDVNKTSAVLGRLVKAGFLVDMSVNPRLKRYEISVERHWLGIWLRAKKGV